MIIPRVIPLLLVSDGGLVKTIRYRDPTYVGDPINVINLFNQFEVDEIVVLDIDARREQRRPYIDLISQLAGECWVPLAYGGGLTELPEVARVLSVGVEKVVLGEAVFETPALVSDAAREFGAQAVVASIDARRRRFGGYETVVRNATRAVGLDPIAAARRAVELGAGEILLNAVDRDGTMDGYDLDLTKAVSAAVPVPVIACGGGGTRQDLRRPIREAGAAAVAAGSLFVFQGRSRGVLVNFPARSELEALIGPS